MADEIPKMMEDTGLVTMTEEVVDNTEETGSAPSGEEFEQPDNHEDTEGAKEQHDEAGTETEESGQTEEDEPATDKPILEDDSEFLIPKQGGGYEKVTGKELRGRMLLKSRYDQKIQEWRETEQQPLQEKADKWEKVDKLFREHPDEWLLANTRSAAEAGAIDLGWMLSELVKTAQAQGVGVELVDKEYNPYRPERQFRNTAPQDNPEVSDEYEKLQQENRALRMEAWKAKALPKFDGVATDEVIAQAEELYDENPDFFAKTNKDNPLEAALRYVLAQMDDLVPMSQRSQVKGSGKPSRKRPQPKAPDVQGLDPELQKMVDEGLPVKFG